MYIVYPSLFPTTIPLPFMQFYPLQSTSFIYHNTLLPPNIHHHLTSTISLTSNAIHFSAIHTITSIPHTIPLPSPITTTTPLSCTTPSSHLYLFSHLTCHPLLFHAYHSLPLPYGPLPSSATHLLPPTPPHIPSPSLTCDIYLISPAILSSPLHTIPSSPIPSITCYFPPLFHSLLLLKYSTHTPLCLPLSFYSLPQTLQQRHHFFDLYQFS